MYINPFIHFEDHMRLYIYDYQLVPLVYNDIRLGRYFISNYGELYDVYQNRWVNGWMQKDGYLRYSFDTQNNIQKKYYAHVLVANTFLVNPNPELYTVVNHIDGDKLNCHPSNLEFCTPQQNAQHAARTGLCKGSIFPERLIHEICVKLMQGWDVRKICELYSMYSTYTLPQLKTLIDNMRKGNRYPEIYNLYNINF